MCGVVVVGVTTASDCAAMLIGFGVERVALEPICMHTEEACTACTAHPLYAM